MNAEQNLGATRMLDLLGGDAALLRHVGTLFLADYRDALTRLHVALAAVDRDALHSVVHSLKGSAAGFGAVGAVALAQEIEKACRANDLSAVPAIAERFSQEIAALAKLIAAEIEHTRS